MQQNNFYTKNVFSTLFHSKKKKKKFSGNIEFETNEKLFYLYTRYSPFIQIFIKIRISFLQHDSNNYSSNRRSIVLLVCQISRPNENAKIFLEPCSFHFFSTFASREWSPFTVISSLDNDGSWKLLRLGRVFRADSKLPDPDVGP